MASGTEQGDTARVVVGNDTTTLQVPFYTGRVGQPLTCTSLEAHYTPDNVALAIPHAHSVSGKSNVAMRHMMAYRYCVPLPQGASSVRILSSDARLLLLLPPPRHRPWTTCRMPPPSPPR